MRRTKLVRNLVVLLVLVCLAAAAVLRSSSAMQESARQLESEQERDFEAEEEEEAEADYPFEASEFRSLQLQNDHGRVPPNALLQSVAHRNEMVAAAKKARRVTRSGDKTSNVASTVETASLATGGIGRDSWSPIGPGNIGGRIRSIIIDPANTSNMWVGSATGGIFSTNDGGTSWDPVDDFMANLSVSSLVSPANSTSTMYAGTGEYFAANIRGSGGPEDANRGAGVFQSTDGGVTWNQLPSTINSDWWYVTRLAVSPSSSNTLLASTWSGLWRSENSGGKWDNVYRPASSPQMADVDFDPSNGNNAIAGGYPTARALYSTDGGKSWQAASGISGTGRVEVAYAPSNPSIVYASVNQSSGSLYRSTDGGHSYTLVNNAASYLGTQGNYDNALWVSPTNASRVIVGGINLWMSSDNGSILNQISDWRNSPTSPHADHHAIVNSPAYTSTSNRIVFFGNDGGIYRADDILNVTQTSGWQELNNNLPLTQFYGAAVNETSGTIIGGGQDNGTLRYTGDPNGWSTTFGGDGGYVSADQANSNYFYGEYVFGRAFRSSNGGTSAGYISGGTTGNGDCTKAAPYRIPDACNENANFIAPLMLDPNNSNRLLVGGASLWRTDDARTANTSTTGPSWASIKGAISGTKISSIEIQKGNSDVVYVGYNNGLIYKSTNATASPPMWTRVDLQTMPARMVLDISIDPTDSDIVYASFGGFSADNVWRSSDGGSNWESRVGSGVTGLPQVPVRSLLVNSSNHDWLYVGTEIGVFVSENGGQDWAVPNSGPANVPVDQLFWRGADLIAATFGRGLFTTQVDTTPRPPNDDFSDAEGLSGNSGSSSGTNVGATVEAGEPVHDPEDPSVGAPFGSVWWTWTPAASGMTTIDTAGSSIDTVLSVYQGSAVDSLTLVAANDDQDYPNVLTSSVSFEATAGETYRIAVDGWDDTERGAVALNFALSASSLCAGQAVTVDMNLGQTPTGGADVILGTSSADTILAGGGNDVVCAAEGNDSVFGETGDDAIYGGAGNDTIKPGSGNDSVDGETGKDDVNYLNDATVSSGVTVDLSVTGPQATVSAGTETIANVEKVTGTIFGDTLAGTSGANSLYGKGGADTLNGVGGSDMLFPGAGNDVSVNGGSGQDTVVYSDLTTGVTVDLSAPSTSGAAGTDTLVSIERATGTKGTDRLTGTNLVNVLKGLGGNDQLFGLDGNDTLDGGPGPDSLDGGGGTDTCKNGESNQNCEL